MPATTTNTPSSARPSLSARLASVSESNKAIVQLIHRLSRLNFQPGSTPLDTDQGDVRLELGSDIHESLKQSEEELELLRQEVEELAEPHHHHHTAGIRRRESERESERENERAKLAIQVARLTEDLRHSRSLFRKAQLQAKRNSELAKQKERELLFAGIQEGSGNSTVAGRRKGQEKLSKDDIEAAASSDVTAALRRTQQLMQTELSRSQFAQETLDQSTAALADLGDRYTNLDSLLSSSRNLVSSLITSQKSDTWYLETTLWVILFTFAWLVLRIIFRRLQLIYWFVWLLFLPFKLTYQVLFWSLPGKAGVASSSLSHTTSTVPTVHVPSINLSPTSQAQPVSETETETATMSASGSNDKQESNTLSQKVGQMAEAAEQAIVGDGSSSNDKSSDPPIDAGHQGEQEKKEPILRGDGQPLVESDRPRNPKKRMWDENVERAKYEEAQRNKDEL